MSKTLAQISQAGTSIWLDDLSRERMIDNGKSRSLRSLIAEESVVGVTTNPAIFSSSISQSSLYSDDLKALAAKGYSAEQIITELTCSDVAKACDLFKEVFLASGGVDGRVSIEVDPRFALISEGISINVTIIFSTKRYEQVLDAFIKGLEDRTLKSLPLTDIHSVASFFISRVDTEIDPRLKANASKEALDLLGKSAIANAHLAYQHFEEVLHSDRWQVLAKLGGNIQRPLWASTGVKDPNYDPTQYVMELVAPLCVNTMPEQTLSAVKAQGEFKGNSIPGKYLDAAGVINQLTSIGIDIEEVAEKLEREGIDKFIKPWLELIANVEAASK
jgi:transaldolase